MDFYHCPTSCSQATHIMLHETGAPFSAHAVDIRTGKLADGGDYAEVNCNGYVPALVLLDGAILTESVAILDRLTRATGGVSADGADRTRHLQLLAFVATELHKPFVRLFFTESDVERADLCHHLDARLRWIGRQVRGPYLMGEGFTGADAFLYVMTRWAAMCELVAPPSLIEHSAIMERRPSVRAVLAAEKVEPLHPGGGSDARAAAG